MDSTVQRSQASVTIAEGPDTIDREMGRWDAGRDMDSVAPQSMEYDGPGLDIESRWGDDDASVYAQGQGHRSAEGGINALPP